MFWWFCADFSNLGGLFGVGKRADNENGRERRRIKREDEKRRQAEIEAQFGTIFTYSDSGGGNRQQLGIHGALSDADDRQNWPLSDRFLHGLCTVFSAAFLLLTLPFSLPFSLKFIGPSERVLILRLGRTKGVHGPGGTALVLPWVDRAVTVDLRVSSIDLPPIQAVTADHGMVELTVTVFSQITDPLVMYCNIQDVKETLLSLAYATLCRRLCKVLLSDLTNSTSMERVLLAKCQAELNAFVLPRGVSVERVAVTRLTVLKQADSAGTAMSVLRTLARSQFGQQLFDQFGSALLTQQQNFCAPTTTPITPELIITDDKSSNYERSAASQQQQAASAAAASSLLSPVLSGEAAAAPFDQPACSSGANANVGADQRHHHQQHSVAFVPPPSAHIAQPLGRLDADLAALLERIGAVLCPSLVLRVGRLFRVRCLCFSPLTMPPVEKAFVEFDIDLRAGNGWCGWTWQRMGPPPPCDVLFTLQKCTLLALLDGTVSPLCAYLEGRVQIDGPVQDAALLKHLANAIGTANATPPTATDGQRGEGQILQI